MRTLRARGAALVAVFALLLASVAVADVFLLDFYGYDYWSPYTAPPETPGNCYNAIGFVPSENPTYLTFNHATHEYTFSLQGVCIASSMIVGDYKILNFSGGTFDAYGDPFAGGTAADYGTSPPNATAPSTFEDGTLEIGGDVNSLQIVIHMPTGNADLSGEIDLTRGAQLGNIPVAQRSGWTLAGLRAYAPGLPSGYYWQIDGQLFIQDPVPVERQSWGGVKRSFQGED